jgi:hypothetical protein
MLLDVAPACGPWWGGRVSSNGEVVPEATGIAPEADTPGDSTAVAALAEVRAAFARGDYAAVRLLAAKMRDGEIHASAREELDALVARTAPDPAAVRVFWIAVAVVLVVCAVGYLQGRAPH